MIIDAWLFPHCSGEAHDTIIWKNSGNCGPVRGYSELVVSGEGVEGDREQRCLALTQAIRQKTLKFKIYSETLFILWETGCSCWPSQRSGATEGSENKVTIAHVRRVFEAFPKQLDSRWKQNRMLALEGVQRVICPTTRSAPCHDIVWPVSHIAHPLDEFRYPDIERDATKFLPVASSDVPRHISGPPVMGAGFFQWTLEAGSWHIHPHNQGPTSLLSAVVVGTAP